MLRCRQATRIISDSHERSLSLQEKVGVQMHLIACPHCRNFKRNCNELSHLMQQFAGNGKK